MNKWTIKYDNDVGADDESFWEWWTVTDGDKSFKCDEETDAKWLCELLNASTPKTPQNNPLTCSKTAK